MSAPTACSRVQPNIASATQFQSTIRPSTDITTNASTAASSNDPRSSPRIAQPSDTAISIQRSSTHRTTHLSANQPRRVPPTGSASRRPARYSTTEPRQPGKPLHLGGCCDHHTNPRIDHPGGLTLLSTDPRRHHHLCGGVIELGLYEGLIIRHG